MKLYYSNDRQNPKNSIYPNYIEVSSLSDFTRAVSYDNTCSKCKDNHRKNSNFLEADCSMFDIDNTHSENSADWVTPADIRKYFPDVEFYISYSRNNMKEKNGKPARPKFHVYFADIVFTSADEYTQHKQKVCDYFTAFDPNAKDAARFFYGVENPQVEYFEGKTLLYNYMQTVKIDRTDSTSAMQDKPTTHREKRITSYRSSEIIPEGKRNNTLVSCATSLLKRFGDCDNSYSLYIKRSECCVPRLSDDEVQTIWNSAVKFYTEKIKTSADYVSPVDFDISKDYEIFTEKYELPIVNHKEFERLIIKSFYTFDVNLEITRLLLHSFGITVRNNDMTHRLEIRGLPEKYQGEDDFKTLRVLLNDICKALHFKNRASLEPNIALLSLENRYHPVIDILLSDEWDGIDRLQAIYKILNVTDELHKILIRKWAIQTMALLFNDNNNPIAPQGILVLQGAQGVGKTEFFRHLAITSKFFKEGSVIDTSNKDTKISSTSVWICELGELDSTTQKKQADLKAFITSAVDNYRVPYDKREVIRARRTSFCGTVNPKAFLNDETGNRRYWTIPVTKIELDEVFKHSREWYIQFWRQMFCEYQENQKSYLLTADEMKMLNKRNEEHEVDVYGEDEFLATFDIKAPTEDWTYRTASDIVEILNNEYKKLNLSSSAFGKTLLPKLERKYGIDFSKKTISGRQFRHCPPLRRAFATENEFDDFGASYHVDISSVLSDNNDDYDDYDDVVF